MVYGWYTYTILYKHMVNKAKCPSLGGTTLYSLYFMDNNNGSWEGPTPPPRQHLQLLIDSKSSGCFLLASGHLKELLCASFSLDFIVWNEDLSGFCGIQPADMRIEWIHKVFLQELLDGWPTPLKKNEFVNWDENIPNGKIFGVHGIWPPHLDSPTIPSSFPDSLPLQQSPLQGKARQWGLAHTALGARPWHRRRRKGQDMDGVEFRIYPRCSMVLAYLPTLARTKSSKCR